ncbi:MAG: septum site-determining protein MinC [Tissierellia bacterium]|nr:septum site-determining protein MinC [Tissierellia bacterium]
MKEGLVSFKGIKEGIYIYIKDGDFQDILDELEEKLKDSLDFYKEANFLGIKAENLKQSQIIELLYLMKYRYDLHIANEGLLEHMEISEYYTGIKEGMTKFIHSTIRSGQVIEYDGNIVIIGDVNPGALIKAKGNIIILGTIRGVAHAGIDGNKDAIVAAYDLRPTQLRIANIIGRKPDEETLTSGIPEVAKIKDGEVYIEPYLPNK